MGCVLGVGRSDHKAISNITNKILLHYRRIAISIAITITAKPMNTGPRPRSRAADQIDIYVRPSVRLPVRPATPAADNTDFGTPTYESISKSKLTSTRGTY